MYSGRDIIIQYEDEFQKAHPQAHCRDYNRLFHADTWPPGASPLVAFRTSKSCLLKKLTNPGSFRTSVVKASSEELPSVCDVRRVDLDVRFGRLANELKLTGRLVLGLQCATEEH